MAAQRASLFLPNPEKLQLPQQNLANPKKVQNQKLEKSLRKS